MINVESLPRKLRDLGKTAAEEPHELNLPEMEKRVILKALEKTGWNQSQAAIALGISRKQLRTKMKNLNLLEE
jgi:DNA-binding NtrC family response regulator